MSECLLSPGPVEDYFSEDDRIHVLSIGYSNEMHANPEMKAVRSVMTKAYGSFLDLSSHLEEKSAHLAAARKVRASVGRVVGHHAAMSMASVAVSLLNGYDRRVAAVSREVSWRAMVQPSRAGIKTDFERVWFGDDARHFLTACLVTQPTIEQTGRVQPLGIRIGLHGASIRVRSAARDVIKHRGLEGKLIGRNGIYDPGKNPRENFVSTDGCAPAKWQEAFLIDALANSSPKNADEFLAHNTESSHEHVLALLSDAFHAFQQYPDANFNDIVRSLVASLHLPSKLAFMGNRQNGHAEYKDRYVEGKHREPLVVVDKQYTIHPNPASAFAKAKRSQRGGCPGPDPLTPIGRQIDVSAELREVLSGLLAGYDQEIIDRLKRDFSDIDVVAAVNIGVARILNDRGITTFSPKSVAHNLRPEHQILSAGPYIFGKRTPVSLEGRVL